MKTKQIVEEAVEEPKFDGNGKLLIPLKENGITRLANQEEIAKLLKKKNNSKEIIETLVKHGTKKKSKSEKSKEKLNPEFERKNTVARDAWMKQIIKEFKLEVDWVQVNNESMPKEPVLSYKGKRILWCAPRAGMLWSNYRFGKDVRVITKIHNEVEVEAETAWVQKRIKEIDSLPSVKAKDAKKSKGKKGAIKKAPSVISKLNEIEAKVLKNHGAGFSIRSLRIKNDDPELVAWVKEHGYKLNANNVYVSE